MKGLLLRFSRRHLYGERENSRSIILMFHSGQRYCREINLDDASLASRVMEDVQNGKCPWKDGSCTGFDRELLMLYNNEATLPFQTSTQAAISNYNEDREQ